MNIEEYISSGIIETYVMGAATPEEERELLALADQHPEIRREIESARDAMESYAKLHSKQPPSFLKEKIMARTVGTRMDPNNGEVRRSGLSVSFLKPLAVAASLLLVASAAVNIYLYQKLDSAENELAVLQTRNQLLVEENKIQKAGYDIVMHDMNVLKNPATKMVVMTDTSNQMKAMVYWNRETSETFVSIDNMPELPQGKQFQLWAFIEGKPVDMGLFDMKKGSLIKLKTTSAAEKFAVTLEDAGNGPVPHGPVVVIGSI